MIDLLTVSAEQLDEWRGVLDEYANAYGSLIVISDTETSGSQLLTYAGKYHRVLEWSLRFCYKGKDGLIKKITDSSGAELAICEPLNPWLEIVKTSKQKLTVTEIEREAINVHGITEEYLMGQQAGIKRGKLTGPAASFDTLFSGLQRVLNFPKYMNGNCPVFIHFYNAIFDATFINNELEMCGKPPLESFFFLKDPMHEIKSLMSQEHKLREGKGKVSSTLDDAHRWLRSKFPELTTEVPRPIHTASIDTEILYQVVRCLDYGYNNGYFIPK